MKELPQISEAEFEVMKVIWKHAPINTNEITQVLNQKIELRKKRVKNKEKDLK